jgi:hypothetical protein
MKYLLIAFILVELTNIKIEYSGIWKINEINITSKVKITQPTSNGIFPAGSKEKLYINFSQNIHHTIRMDSNENIVNIKNNNFELYPYELLFKQNKLFFWFDKFKEYTVSKFKIQDGTIIIKQDNEIYNFTGKIEKCSDDFLIISKVNNDKNEFKKIELTFIKSKQSNEAPHFQKFKYIPYINLTLPKIKLKL